MKKTLSALFICGMIFLILTSSLFAQDSTSSSTKTVTSAKLFSGTKNYRTFSIGVNMGMMAPEGVMGSPDFTKWLPTFGYGFYLKQQFTHTIALQTDFIRGTLKANDDNQSQNALRIASPFVGFKTNLNWAASLSGDITFENLNWFKEKNVVIPYVAAGGGLASYTPTVYREPGKKARKYQHPVTEFFIPVTAGLKIKVSEGMNIDLGYRVHFINGDNLDGFWARPQNDKFSYGFAGMEFAIGNKTKPQLMLINPAAMMKKDLQDENEALRATMNANQKETQRKIALVDSLQQELAKLKKDADADGVSDYFDNSKNLYNFFGFCR